MSSSCTFSRAADELTNQKCRSVAKAAVQYIDAISCGGQSESEQDVRLKDAILKRMQRASLEMRMVTIVIPKTRAYVTLSFLLASYLTYVTVKL